MKKEAFTLIETLISLSIIVILSSLLVANYKVSNSYSSLVNFQNSLISDLESIKWKAINAQDYNGLVPVYWGLYLEKGSSTYQIFADLNGNFSLDAGEDLSYFGGKKYISSADSVVSKISLADRVLILFSTNNGFPVFYDMNTSSQSEDDLVIELKNNDLNSAKLVVSNSFGLNDFEDCSCNDSTKYCCSFCSGGSSCVSY